MTELLQHPTVLVGIKSLPLLLIGFLANHFMRRSGSSAATRSYVWTGTLVALVLLPVFSRTLPTWHIGILNKPVSSSSTIKPSLAIPILNTSPVPNRNRVVEAVTASTIPTLKTQGAISVPQPSPETPKVPATTTRLSWIPAVWLFGCFTILMSTVLGWLSLSRLQRQARECFDEDWLAALDELKTTLGIRRPIRLVMSKQRDIPMTWGILHPVLHLPLKARQWSETERRAVLLHELAHIQRWDSALQLIAQVSAAFYWYNPLIWIGIQKLRMDQESACDDTALRHGLSAPIYAGHLTSIVSGRSTRPWENAVALAAGRKGKLEARIERILTTQCRRTQPARRHVGAIMSLTVACSLAMGALSPFTPALHGETHTKGEVSREPLSDLGSLQQTLQQHSLQSVDSRTMKRSAIEAMIKSLNDPHAQYLPQEKLANMQVHLNGELFGIGAQLRMVNDQLQIIRPLPGSPALDAGLEPGDIIHGIDQTNATGLALGELVDLIRGPLGTQVRLTILRGGNERKLTVTRGRIKLSSVHGLRGTKNSQGITSPHRIGTGSNLGYFQISYFGKHTAQELDQRITQSGGTNLQGAIIDLRFCPGGALNPAAQVADLFLNRGEIVTIQGRDGDSETITATNDRSWRFPLVILVNGETASAGEIVGAALQDHDRAMVVGTRSFGKTSVQTLLHISDKLGAVKLTTAKYVPPSGRNIDRTPNSPNWGIEANEGFFIPAGNSQATIKNRLQGLSPIDEALIELPSLGPQAIRVTLNDPQLGGAIEALESKLETGRYQPVGGSIAALREHVAQREARTRQETLLKKLQEIQSAVTELEQIEARR